MQPNFIDNFTKEVSVSVEDTALLIIDMQNATGNRKMGLGKKLEAEGKLQSAEYRYDRIEQILIPNILKLADAFRKSNGKIISRIGLEAEAIVVNKEYEFYKEIEGKDFKKVSCIFVDEAQFLSRKQVHDLGKISDELNIPVMCYGIRTDFQGKLFEGSQELLALADNLKELKTICSECDKKATMVVRLNEKGEVVLEGKKIVIGGNEIYKTLCRKHFRELTKLI